MSVGYYDVKTGKYVKTAGNLSILNTPLATESSNGLMSCEDKKKLDGLVDGTEIASNDAIIAIFTN